MGCITSLVIHFFGAPTPQINWSDGVRYFGHPQLLATSLHDFYYSSLWVGRTVSTFFVTNASLFSTEALVLPRCSFCVSLRLRCNGHRFFWLLISPKLAELKLFLHDLQSPDSGHFLTHFVLSGYWRFSPRFLGQVLFIRLMVLAVISCLAPWAPLSSFIPPF